MKLYESLNCSETKKEIDMMWMHGEECLQVFFTDFEHPKGFAQIKLGSKEAIDKELPICDHCKDKAYKFFDYNKNYLNFWI